MELWDIYDINHIKKGKTVVRGDRIEEGDYRIMVHICIFNSEGKMLIQHRTSTKDCWPGLWDLSAGGSAVSGDTSGKAAEREAFEEIGVKLDLENTLPHLSVNFNRGFDDIYLVEKDIDINSLVLQKEEVTEVKWADADEICRLIDEKVFIPYHKNLIRLFFDMRKSYGAIKHG